MVVPAQLGFLVIYNPSLGPRDDIGEEQIVYYYSVEELRARKQRRNRRDGKTLPEPSEEEMAERRRQIGLAQGIIEFGQTFSEYNPVDAIESSKQRLILHELEMGWWILASINFTQIPIDPSSKTATTSQDTNGEAESNIEYSSRDVKPPTLLLQDLVRAHTTFLLHHASSMSALFVRTRRTKFTGILSRYWDSFLVSWNVSLHGNPVVSLYGGIKLAGCGELGIGVGEEERGSGEREVLEGLIGRIDGLVDIVVSRFGAAEEESNIKEAWTKPSHIPPKAHKSWLGTGLEPTTEDGAVFLGCGALSRKSLRDVTHWMEDIYTWGPNAYGVLQNPASTRRPHRAKRYIKNSGLSAKTGDLQELEEQPEPTIDGTNVSSHGGQPQDSAASARALTASDDGKVQTSKKSTSKERRPALQRAFSSQNSVQSLSLKGRKITNFFKFGYGTHWSLGGGSSLKEKAENADLHTEGEETTDLSAQEGTMSEVEHPNGDLKARTIIPDECNYPIDDTVGHYMIGLLGNIDEEKSQPAIVIDQPDDLEMIDSNNSRIVLRTLTVELEREGDARAEADLSIDLGATYNARVSSKLGTSEHMGTSQNSFEDQDRNKSKRLRVVVYVKKPFMFTFLLELRTDSLALESLYRSLHYQLGPLQHPLLRSTSYRSTKPLAITDPLAEDVKTPIYDFLYDRHSLTIHSTIPNIPDLMQQQQQQQQASSETPSTPWTRLEALNTHMQILNTNSACRQDNTGHQQQSAPLLERTCKTSRGWWIVWTRIPDPDRAPTPTALTPMPAAVTPRDDLQSLQSSQEPALRPEIKSVVSRSLAGPSTAASTASMASQSVLSGPAHPFFETISPRESVPRDKEVFLIRRASDHAGAAGRSTSRFATGAFSASDGGWAGSPGRLAQGIGIDTKRYIEGLLSMAS